MISFYVILLFNINLVVLVMPLCGLLMFHLNVEILKLDVEHNAIRILGRNYRRMTGMVNAEW